MKSFVTITLLSAATATIAADYPSCDPNTTVPVCRGNDLISCGSNGVYSTLACNAVPDGNCITQNGVARCAYPDGYAPAPSSQVPTESAAPTDSAAVSSDIGSSTSDSISISVPSASSGVSDVPTSVSDSASASVSDSASVSVSDSASVSVSDSFLSLLQLQTQDPQVLASRVSLPELMVSAKVILLAMMQKLQQLPLIHLANQVNVHLLLHLLPIVMLH